MSDTEKKTKGSFKRAPRKKKTFDKEKYMEERTLKASSFTSPTAQIENDPSWHGADTDFGKDVGSISFNHRVGVALPDDKTTFVSGSGVTYNSYASTKSQFEREYGIVCIDLMSTLPKLSSDVGYSTLLNQVMNKLNAQVRKANAGAKNYEPVDLLIYNLAYSEAACFYAYCCRMYGAVLNYDKHNAYFAESYVRATGGNYSDLKDKLPQFRAFLKSFATRLNALTAIELPYFKRKVVLCSNTYKDEKDGLNCQIYVPRFRQWLIFEVDPTNGSTLRSSNNTDYYSWTDWNGDFTNMTLAGIEELGNYMLNQLLTDADVATMSGDLLKRFEGTSAIVNLAWIDENYYVMPQYSEEFLEEFENCSMPMCGAGNDYVRGAMKDVGSEPTASNTYYYPTPYGLTNPYFGEITQNSGNIVQVNEYVYVGAVSALYGANVIKANVPRTVNFKSGEVTPSRLITATRLLATSSSVISPSTIGTYNVRYQTAISQCDTEIVVGMTVYTAVNPAALGNPISTVFWSDVHQRDNAAFIGNLLAQFKYLCPQYFCIISATTMTYTGLIRNMDKAAVITQANIDGMITCSSVYEFGLNEDSAMNK